MTHLSQNLDKLIQMISIEQLLGIVKQTNNSNSTSNISDILSLPIVQKVVKAYEDEIEMLKSKMNTNTSCNKCCSCKDYSDDISKIHEQLATINATLNATIQNMQINKSVNDNILLVDDEHIRLKIEEKEEGSNEVVLVVPKVVEDEEESEEEDEVESVDELVEEEAEDLEEESVVPKVEEELEELEEDESEKEISDSESEVEVDEEVEDEETVSGSNEVEEVETVAGSNEVEEEDDEEEVFEIEIDDITYYATGEENGILYAVDDDGEVGKQVGIIKDGEPIFS